MRMILLYGLALSVSVSAKAQDATMPAVAEHSLLTVQGRGVQVYTCKLVSGSGQWVFVAPAARLFDMAGVEIGSHGDGPVWHLLDGSSVQGKVVATSVSPDAGSVPWLLLKAVARTGEGKLTSTEFIRRSETKGGVAPGGGCDAGALLRMPYTATYTFYSAK